MRFDRHTVVLLVRPPDAPELMTWQVPAGSVRFENHHPPRFMAEAEED